MAGQRPTPSGAGNTVGIASQLLPVNVSIDGRTQIPLFTAAQRLVLENIVVRFNVANGTALTGHIARVANGVVLTTNTDVTATNGINFNAGANTNVVPAFVTGANGPTENIVEAGETVILELNTAAATVAARLVTVTFEITNKIN